MKVLTLRTAALALLSGTALAGSPVLAQDATAPAPAAAPAADAPAQADEIVVTGNVNREGQRKLDASYSISTASEEQIRQVQPLSTADLLKIVPGVWTETSGGETGANVFIRGFPSTGDAPFLTIEMNGSPIIAPSSLSFLEDSSLFRIDDTVQRVEVLRGGPSPIFANGQPGATTNFILKEGTQDPQFSVRGTYGTEGMYRGDVVAQGPIDENTTYMVGGFYRYSKGLRHTGFRGDDGGQITASVTHKFDAGKLTVYGRYLNDERYYIEGAWLLARGASFRDFGRRSHGPLDRIQTRLREDECRHAGGQTGNSIGVHCAATLDEAVRSNSSSIFSFTRPSANSAATRMAFLTAFALELPWQMVQTPFTPSSGAPPYSA